MEQQRQVNSDEFGKNMLQQCQQEAVDPTWPADGTAEPSEAKWIHIPASDYLITYCAVIIHLEQRAEDVSE